MKKISPASSLLRFLKKFLRKNQALLLHFVSMGRKADMEALQRVQNQAMMWIGGEGRRAFRINTSLEKLGWLDIGQTAAKASIDCTEGDPKWHNARLARKDSES